MRQRLVRLTLGAAVAVVALAPATSHAVTCGTKLQQVCNKLAVVCALSDVSKTVCDKVTPL
jgi:hypothetical protein